MYSALIPASPLTVAPVCTFTETLFDRFTEYTDVTEKTMYGYLNGLNAFRKWLADNGITQPQREDIKAFKNYLKENGYAVTTQGNYFRTVKHFFKWLSSEGLYPNVADNLKGVKVSQDNTRKDAFEKADLSVVLASIDRGDIIGLRDYAIIQLCATCALRIIEINRANIEDLQMKRGEHILYVQGKGHNEKDEFVKIPADLYKNIEAYLVQRTDTGKDKPLFASAGNRARIAPDGSRDTRLSEPSLSTIIKTRFIEAGYDMGKLTAHSLRHTGVTALLKANGGNIQQAQRYARHKNINTTLIYSHNIDREKDSSEQMVYEYLFGNDPQPVTDTENRESMSAAIEALKPLTADQLKEVVAFINRMQEQNAQKPA